MGILLDNLIEQFREVRDGSLWMGDSFADKLEALDPGDAFLQPVPGMHSAAELLAHLAAWREDALLKIRTGKGRLRDRDAANWPEPESLAELGWDTVLQRFDSSLDQLLRELAGRDDAFLEATYYDQDYGAEFPYAYLLNGLFHHDLYHLGQLGLVLKFLKQN